MRFFKELVDYDTKNFTGSKTTLFYKYILKMESYLNLPQYHKYSYNKEACEDRSYNEMQEYISYQDYLLLRHLLKDQSMESLFLAFDISDDFKHEPTLQESVYDAILKNENFSELQDKQLLDVKVMSGDSLAQILRDIEWLLETAVRNGYQNREFYPSMFIMIRENEDLLYKIHFLKKIGYPIEEKRLRCMLDGKFFMDTFRRSKILVNGNLYHVCILTLDSKVNLWKWITLKQEHDYIEKCYIDALSGNWKRKEN